jgi:hypothetical protein
MRAHEHAFGRSDCSVQFGNFLLDRFKARVEIRNQIRQFSTFCGRHLVSDLCPVDWFARKSIPMRAQFFCCYFQLSTLTL